MRSIILPNALQKSVSLFFLKIRFDMHIGRKEGVEGRKDFFETLF
jgi:hypothetical protein